MQQQRRKQFQIGLLGLSFVAFMTSFTMPFFIVGPRPSRFSTEGDYVRSDQAICGLATSPNTACATDLVHRLFKNSQPIQCGTPDAMAQLLKERSTLTLVSPETVEDFCKNWQSAKVEYKLQTYQAIAFGWVNFVMGEFWAWSSLALGIFAIIFMQRKPDLSLLFAGCAVAVGLSAFTVSQWSYFNLGFAPNPYPIVSVSGGFYAFEAALILLFAAIFIPRIRAGSKKPA